MHGPRNGTNLHNAKCDVNVNGHINKRKCWVICRAATGKGGASSGGRGYEVAPRSSAFSPSALILNAADTLMRLTNQLFQHFNESSFLALTPCGFFINTFFSPSCLPFSY